MKINSEGNGTPLKINTDVLQLENMSLSFVTLVVLCHVTEDV